MKCSLCGETSIDSIDVETGNNAEYCINVELCQLHLDESDKLGYYFESKYGKELNDILNNRYF